MKYSTTIRKEFLNVYEEAHSQYVMTREILLTQSTIREYQSGKWIDNDFTHTIPEGHIFTYLDAERDHMESLVTAQWIVNADYRCYFMHLHHRYYQKFVMSCELNDDNLAVMLKLSLS